MPAVLSRSDRAQIEAALPSWSDSSPEAADALRRLLDILRASESDFCSTGEAAQVFGVTQQTVRNWVDRGWLPGSRLESGHRMIPRVAVERAARFLAPPPERAELSEVELEAITQGPRKKRR
jgi:excisionase family DNA binding protein